MGAKVLIRAFVGVVAMAAPVWGGVNPRSPGLPVSWTMTESAGYGAVAVSGNNASSMCVECHEANPSNKVRDPSGPLIGPGWQGGAPVHFGSHAVMNNWVTKNSGARGTTHSGGGFEGSATGGVREGGEYMTKAAWNTGGVAGVGYSKYSQGEYVSTTAPTDWADADLICESCHSVLINEGAGLLLGGYDEVGDDRLCVVCHAVTGGAATRASFHRNGNLQAFSTSAAQAAFTGVQRRKRHHVMEGDVVTAEMYDPDGDPASIDSVMWAPSFSGTLDTAWCGSGAYTRIDAPNSIVSFPFNPAFRGACNVTGVGTRAAPVASGDIPTGTRLLCTSCHRAHNAQTGGGAFILRTGSGLPVGRRTDYRGGLTRQFDVGPYGSAKVYVDYEQVCAGCHQGYGTR